MKGQYIIVNIKDMDYYKDSEGKVIIVETLERAGLICGINEWDNVWICELKYNHIEI